MEAERVGSLDVTFYLVPSAESTLRRMRDSLESFLEKFRQPFLSSVLIGLIGFLISWAASWIPSPWLDEAATAHIISYPLADMARLWEQTDAVYAPYYIFMHFWVKVLGTTPFTLRLPSLLAVGVGTAAMAMAGRTVAGPRAQLLYGLCFALLPRTAAMGIEGRPYAMSSMFMALSLAAVVKLRLVPRTWLWVLLGVSLVGAVASQFFSVLPIFGLVIVAAALFPLRSRIVLLVVSALAALVCLPLANAAIGQKNQVSWIGDEPYSILNQALVEAWFTSRWSLNPAEGTNAIHNLAIFLSLLAGLTLLAAITFGRERPAARLLLAAVPPFVATVALWGASLADSPVLLGRYLTSSAPFFSMLLAECLMLLKLKPKIVLSSLLLTGSILLIVAQREPYAKIPANDYAFIASALTTQAAQGDGLLIEPGLGPVDSARNAVDLYPKTFDRLVDVAQPQRPPLSFVFATDPPIVDIGQHAVPNKIWLVTKTGQVSNYETQLIEHGFVKQFASSGPGHAISSWSKK